jgi:ubiquitin-protein ligase
VLICLFVLYLLCIQILSATLSLVVKHSKILVKVWSKTEERNKNEGIETQNASGTIKLERLEGQIIEKSYELENQRA